MGWMGTAGMFVGGVLALNGVVGMNALPVSQATSFGLGVGMIGLSTALSMAGGQK